MTDDIRQKIDGWYKIHGTMSAVFLQAKLNVSFKQAEKLIDEFMNGK